MSINMLTRSPSGNGRWKRSSALGIERKYSTVRAESDAGKVSFELLDIILKNRIKTITDPPDDTRLARELADILAECSVPDWNGYGALPIDRKSVEYVCQFLGKLPVAISYPELASEPTGDLTMVWRKNGYHLIVGIDASKEIAWGGTSPSGHVYGDANFVSDIPYELVSLLHSVEGIGRP